MDEGKTNEPVRILRDNPRQFSVGLGIVGVKGGKDNGLVDAGSAGAAQIRVQWRISIPGRGQHIALTSVAMAVNDHRLRLYLRWTQPAIKTAGRNVAGA